jgi:sugar phosphate isomerase/epimerase
MKLVMMRSLWGVIHTFEGTRTLPQALKAIAGLGYDGIEVPFKMALQVGSDKFKQMLEDHNLRVGFQVFSDGPLAPGCSGVAGGPYAGQPQPGPTPEEHLEVFRDQVRGTLEFNPLYVNSHSGKDHFTVDEADRFFQPAVEFQKDEVDGLLLMHETHRKRYLHSPWVARDFLPRYPDIKLCADFSHWVTVAEANCADEALNEVIAQVAPQVHHIHARIGYDHGPQVSDPRAPEWRAYTEGHEKWWGMVWDAQAQRKQGLTTMCPEHGPAFYQQALPYTCQPVADIWEVNHWLALRQQKHFANKFGMRNTSELWVEPHKPTF